ncbi:MAG: ssDNA-binding domain-containing protein, partial [Taibaiella sp.]|nr:ssDNA-binding domain-containing protein [Taibaiella sp.]
VIQMTTQTKKSSKDVYAIITDKIIERLEQGTIPWRKPWADAGIPTNLVSKRPYRGINLMLLAMQGYEYNVFLTSTQLKEIGGSIKRDEKPHLVVFYNYTAKEAEQGEEEAETKKRSILRYYTVFNIAQCDNIPEKLIPTFSRDIKPIVACEKVVEGMPNKPKLQHKEQRAFYDPLKDYVNVPKMQSFNSNAAYYSTLFHELAHSTGHHSRLNRQGLIEMSEFGSDPYSLEELVAEIGSCYLQSHVGIEDEFEQSAGYIQGWLDALKNDRRFIFTASNAAQKAVDYILDVRTEGEYKSEE